MLQIHWQADVCGDRVQYRTSLFGQSFVLTVVDGVVVDTSWLLSAESEPGLKLVMWEELEHVLVGASCGRQNIKLLEQGTPYARTVWEALTEIPVGQVMTYSGLAKWLNSGPRAVALACRNNPYPGIIPCHRVVSKSGIGGFMGFKQGEWVRFKQGLLDYERQIT